MEREYTDPPAPAPEQAPNENTDLQKKLEEVKELLDDPLKLWEEIIKKEQEGK